MTDREVIDYLDRALKLFETDPADSEYQKGFEAALRVVREYIEYASAEGVRE